jgi:anti-sigma28 factor (negative regulator of flagellin synthesis)
MPDPRNPLGDDAESAYDPEYLREVADAEARQERLEELKRRIAQGAYHPDPTSIAEGMLSRGEESPPSPPEDAPEE